MTVEHPVISPKKLIEVALPLDAINEAALKEKSIRHGHPSTLHLWWARRPLAAARAVIFSQLVNDPEDLWRCQHPGEEPNAQVRGHWTKARARLFSLIEELVKWENISNSELLKRAHCEIQKSWGDVCELNKDHPKARECFNPSILPPLHDPFAGGGAIPIEAQRLGIQSIASDLNPVPVLINKAMIEIPPRFAGVKPVNPASRNRQQLLDSDWQGVAGLASDVRWYGKWMREEAKKRVQKYYPSILVTKDMTVGRPDLEVYVGKQLNVVAWIWARTVYSSNPAFSHIQVPLASTFVLSTKEGRETYIQPEVNSKGYSFSVVMGPIPKEAKTGTKSARGPNFRCLMSQTAIPGNHIKAESIAGRMGQRLMAIVAEGERGRVYLSPTIEHEEAANVPSLDSETASTIHVPLDNDVRAIWCILYGLTHIDHLFTRRQLLALSTMSDLVSEAREKVYADAMAAGMADDYCRLNNGGCSATAYSEAVSVYLAFCVQNLLDDLVTQCVWRTSHGTGALAHAFSRQGIPMTWDFPEANPFADAAGDLLRSTTAVALCVDQLPASGPQGLVSQLNATTDLNGEFRFVSTDPPYYDNIGYAALSDFFYVWMRRSLKHVFPDLLATISVPKSEELIAAPYRHGGKEQAERFFLEGMSQAMLGIKKVSQPGYPVAIYYAFKQSETARDGTSSTGWDTFLEAVIRSGLLITGTWPMRTERTTGVKGNSNALASSIILVCRARPSNSGTISRRQFIRFLNESLPLALDAMTRESEGIGSPVAPVDLSQAIIGPGMAIYSKYDAVLEADGSPMTVKTALQLINRFLAEDDFDTDTQFCLHWFEQYGWETGKFGGADTLARAKGTSVDGVKQAGVLHAAGGNVRLLKWAEYPSDWDPHSDQRLPIWEVLHQLIRVFNTDGETGAAAVFAAVQSKAEAARQLAYRLYTLCERKNWAEDARAYNEVVTSWSSIESAAAKEPAAIQRTLFDN